MNTKLIIKFFTLLFSFVVIDNAKGFMFWNQACSFSGAASSYITFPHSPSLDITSNFTLECWIHPTNSTSPVSQIILDKRTGTLAKGYTLYLNNGRVAIGTNSATRLIGNTVIQNNVWTHIAATYNASSNLFSVYINNTLDASVTILNAAPVSNTDSLKIGKGNVISPFAGSMDEVRIWKRDLSLAQISEFARTSLGAATGVYTQLSLSLTFQDRESTGTDFTLNDWSDNNGVGKNHSVSGLDLSNRPSTTISPNECLELDGINDYLSGAGLPDVSPSAAMTIESWIFPRTVSGISTIVFKGLPGMINYSLRLSGNILNGVINNNASFAATTIITPNLWTHVAFTYNGSDGRYVFYINGKKSGQSVIPAGMIPSTTQDFNIGGTVSSGSNFDGFIDEVRISNYVKTQPAINNFLYRSIDKFNEPNTVLVNVVYNLDGYAFDNVESGPKLIFFSDASFSHPATTNNQPVSPINRADNLNFQNSFILKTSNFRIPASGTTGVVADTLQISFDTLINDVNVFVALNHTAEEELKISLIGPNGESVLLFDNRLLAGNADNIITIFNDQADSSVLNNSRYISYSPSIKPKNPLNSVFAGKRTPGKWKLLINDEFGIGSGRAYSWGIQFNGMAAIVPGLSLRVFMQGFYREIDSCVADTIKVHLRESVSPYQDVGMIDESPDEDFIGHYNFPFAVLGQNYYLQVNHRNSIETWSADPIAFDLLSGGLTYDFTVSADRAFGSNQIEVEDIPLRFAMYGGDIRDSTSEQDGNVDIADVSAVDNDVYAFEVGYVNTDVTGDNVVDLSDLSITENNSFNFISKIVPP
ncbi:MAG: proprotein convertase P-domain-containing protein [Bacteroidota bacterium]|nr:proprotein convertase P-domain-containing protein [Bacteroidota bacterium]